MESTTKASSWLESFLNPAKLAKKICLLESYRPNGYSRSYLFCNGLLIWRSCFTLGHTLSRKKSFFIVELPKRRFSILRFPVFQLRIQGNALRIRLVIDDLHAMASNVTDFFSYHPRDHLPDFRKEASLLFWKKKTSLFFLHKVVTFLFCFIEMVSSNLLKRIHQAIFKTSSG